MVEACEICWSRPSETLCPLCGRAVCKDDFLHDKGHCVLCEDTLCEICGRRHSIGYCLLCGRLGCDGCLVQVDNVRRVCRECLARFGGRRGALEALKVRPRPIGPLRVTSRLLG